MTDTAEETIGDRIRRFRKDADLSLSQLAAKASVSKGYISAIENQGDKRPSGETLYAIAEALGVTMSALLGRRLLAAPLEDIPESLQRFAEQRGLPENDVAMLARIEFRGVRPQTSERWEHIYNAIRTSQQLDQE